MNSSLVNGLLAGESHATEALAATAGKVLDFDDPQDNLYAFGKIWGSYDAPVLSGFHGLMYARIGAQRLIPLFGYTGTGCMQSKIDRDGNVWIRGKETGYFTDLVSGEILATWKNPWTGKTVEVFNFYNPAMGGKLTAEMPRFAMGGVRDGATLMNDGTHRSLGAKCRFCCPSKVAAMTCYWLGTTPTSTPIR